jgi:hypothetical protein
MLVSPVIIHPTSTYFRSRDGVAMAMVFSSKIYRTGTAIEDTIHHRCLYFALIASVLTVATVAHPLTAKV